MPSDRKAGFLLTLDELRAREGGKWRKYPPEVLPAYVADMDFAVAPAVQRVIERLVEHRDYGYGQPTDPARVAHAFARRMRERFDWDVDPELVLCPSDVVQAIIASILAFTEPGDGIVVQTPIYPPFLMALRLTGRRLIENRLCDDGERFVIDVDGLRSAVDAGARMLLFCSPHNPTGRAFTREELEAVSAVALEHDLVVVSDEIHSDLVYPGHDHVPIGSLSADVTERTVTLSSATKGFNIAGLRCAVAAFGGVALFERFQARIPDHLMSRPNRFGIEATIAAWSDAGEWLSAVLDQLGRNRAHVTHAFAGIEGIGHHPPEATYLAWLDCNGLALAAASPYEFFLERAKVGLSDGAEFGEAGRGCVRLNFATSTEILEQILDRMLEAIHRRPS